jgi:hypothetical protein
MSFKHSFDFEVTIKHAPCSRFVGALMVALLLHPAVSSFLPHAQGLVGAAIVVTENQSYGNVNCLKLSTPSCTYYYDVDGGGLAGLVDKDGKDWIQFDKNINGSSGAFRGIPNAVHEQDISCFHPLNSDTRPSVTTISEQRTDRVRLSSQSGNWKADWEFFDEYCTFTMSAMTSGKRYWVLYEGTPNGVWEKERSWYLKSDGDKATCKVNVRVDFPDPEWVAFGHDDATRVLLLYNHQGGGQVDEYSAMSGMVVFGFGRNGSSIKGFDEVPRTFSFGFVESTQFSAIQSVARARIEGGGVGTAMRSYAPLTVVKGGARTRLSGLTDAPLTVYRNEISMERYFLPNGRLVLPLGAAQRTAPQIEIVR